jgi:chromosome segregation ATPase
MHLKVGEKFKHYTNRRIIKMSERQMHVDTMKAKIDEWSNDIDEIENKAKNASSDLNEEYQNQIGRLKKQRDDAIVKLEEIQNTTDGAWEDVKKEAEDAWDTISNTFSSAKEKLFDITRSK